MQERMKKGELFFVHMILFYWPATTLTAAVAPRRKEGVAAVQATRRRKEGQEGLRGRTGGDGGGRSE